MFCWYPLGAVKAAKSGLPAGKGYCNKTYTAPTLLYIHPIMFWVLLSQSQQFLGTNSCWIKNISEGDCNSLLVKLHQPYQNNKNGDGGEAL